MATTATRPARSTGRPPTVDWAKQVKKSGRGLPSRLLLHGVEGIGKTSFGAHAPSPIFIMAKGETGLETLIDSGQLKDTPHLPEIQNWQDVLSALEWLTTSDHDHKTLVLDTMNGLERLCHENVCARDFNGDWGETGFTGYQRGWEVSLADWRELLVALDRLREQKLMSIIALTHTKVTPFRNPEGADYDRYAPDMHHKTWGLTHKWADIVLFANYHTVVVKDTEKAKKGKAHGGQQRTLHTVRHAAYDAKNRNGLSETIDMGDDGATAWGNFIAEIKSAKGGK